MDEIRVCPFIHTHHDLHHRHLRVFVVDITLSLSSSSSSSRLSDHHHHHDSYITVKVVNIVTTTNTISHKMIATMPSLKSHYTSSYIPHPHAITINILSPTKSSRPDTS
eukprot:1949152-Rhodomonas_salina.1